MDALPHERAKEMVAKLRPAYVGGKPVAIIGAGPAGLTAAFDLTKSGHSVTVLEAEAEAGGMTRYGIPDYRLPAAALTQDVDVIASLGVDIRYNTRVGKDVTLAQLQKDHDTVLIAVGFWMGRSTRAPAPGSDHSHVRRAVDRLRTVAAGETIDVPRSAVVVGGGNVPVDIARAPVRLQRSEYGQVQVTVTALEALSHFLADPEEVKEAQEEGVVIHDAHGPQEVLLEQGRVSVLRT